MFKNICVFLAGAATGAVAVKLLLAGVAVAVVANAETVVETVVDAVVG